VPELTLELVVRVVRGVSHSCGYRFSCSFTAWFGMVPSLALGRIGQSALSLVAPALIFE
jgi:hypothetical protein